MSFNHDHIVTGAHTHKNIDLTGFGTQVVPSHAHRKTSTLHTSKNCGYDTRALVCEEGRVRGLAAH